MGKEEATAIIRYDGVFSWSKYNTHAAAKDI